MKYLYCDLAEQRRDSTVVVHFRRSAANVILLDALNFDCYGSGQPFEYTGGLHTRTPARLQVPEDGHWYLVIDCGGYQHQVHAEKIEILTPESPTPSEGDTSVVGAAA